MAQNLHDRDTSRIALVCACLFALAPAIEAATRPALSRLTVVLDFKGPHSGVSIQEMEREAAQIMRVSGISLDWRNKMEAAAATFDDLVVMTFKGKCIFTPLPIVYDELGPYGITRQTNGEVQPFGEVDCSRVVSSLRSARSAGIFGMEFGAADLLMGRALGRIVVHELIHMLTKSNQHSQEGVAKATLSARQLIGASLPLSAFDIDRLQQGRKSR